MHWWGLNDMGEELIFGLDPAVFWGLVGTVVTSFIIAFAPTVQMLRAAKREKIEIEKTAADEDKLRADITRQYQVMLQEEQARSQATAEALRIRMAKLELAFDELECKMEEYEKGIKILIEQIQEKGEAPRWRP